MTLTQRGRIGIFCLFVGITLMLNSSTKLIAPFVIGFGLGMISTGVQNDNQED